MHGFIVHAQFTLLQDINLFAGTNEGVYGNGISLYDINDDGYDDITICTKDQGVFIYLNDSLNFEPYNVIPFVPGDLKHPVWVDYDNDHDPDFCVTSMEGIYLFRNDEGSFTDVSDSLHLPSENSVSYGMAWSDYDGDGWLDVYIANYEYFFPTSNTNWLLKNNGQGGFIDVTDACACSNGQSATFQPVWLDADHDLKPDLFVINDKLHGNYYYHNEGGSFSDQSLSSGFYHEMEAMSNSWSDIDHDLLPDAYISNTTAGNVLLRMTEDGFINTAPENDVEINSVCWNAMWLDYDHNGWEDLHVATNSIGINQNINPLFRHVDGEFFPITIQGDNKSVLCSAKGDLNNDGYWDYVEITQYPITTKIFLNDGGQNHWIKCRLFGALSNADGIGAEIHYYVEGQENLRYTFCGEGFLSQDSQCEILSIGQANEIDSLHIQWPSGWIDRYDNLQSNVNYHFTEGETFWYETLDQHHYEICEGDSLSISINTDDDIIWMDGSTAHSRTFFDSGLYVYQVMNEYGFTFMDSLLIESWGIPMVDYKAIDVSCYGGQDGAIIFENVNPDWSITWNVDSLNTQALSAGMYQFNVTDSNGCQGIQQCLINAPDSIVISTTGEAVCADDYSEVQWNINGGIAPFHLMNGENLPDSLLAGDYDFVITDAHDCLVEYSLNIEQLESPTVEIMNESLGSNEILIANAIGGAPPYHFFWNDAIENDTIELSSLGWYHVVASDANGCFADASWEFISHIPELNVSVFVYPNPCTEYLMIPAAIKEGVIMDVKGSVVFAFNQIANNRIDTQQLPVGVYFLKWDDQVFVFKKEY